MRRYLTLILLLAIQPARIFAATIAIDLGPPALYLGTNVGPIPFSDLNGTALNGSSLSLDFLFSGNEFVRLFSSTASLFEVGITLKTNAGTFPGLVIDPSGYLIDQNGNAIPLPDVVGTAQSSVGSTSLGLFPLLLDSSGTPNPFVTFPLDFYGVHFTFILPSSRGVMVTGADFTLFAGGPDSKFAVEPLSAPDSGDAFLLFSIAIAFLLVNRIVTRRFPARTRSRR